MGFVNANLPQSVDTILQDANRKLAPNFKLKLIPRRKKFKLKNKLSIRGRK